MSTFNGTPGPWIQHERTSENTVLITLESNVILAMAYSLPQRETVEANAKAISAVPEMIKALQAISGAEAFISDPHVKSLWHLHVYPAIEKAIGEK